MILIMFQGAAVCHGRGVSAEAKYTLGDCSYSVPMCHDGWNKEESKTADVCNTVCTWTLRFALGC